MAEFTLTVHADDEIMIKAVRKTISEMLASMPESIMTPCSVFERSDEYKAGFNYGVEFYGELMRSVIEELGKPENFEGKV